MTEYADEFKIDPAIARRKTSEEQLRERLRRRRSPFRKKSYDEQLQRKKKIMSQKTARAKMHKRALELGIATEEIITGASLKSSVDVKDEKK